MKKAASVFLMAAMFLFTSVSAGALEASGKTVFLKTETVYAGYDGEVEEVFIEPGGFYEKDDKALSMKTVCVYADLDAYVRGAAAFEGEVLSGEAFLLEPKEKYQLLGSVSYAYGSGENTVVHTGETVYISCTKDSTHWAVGYIASVDADVFTVYTTHGELYVGEAVNVYRQPERTYLSRVGRATVYAADTISFEMEGKVIASYITEGVRVEKGEILLEYLPSARSEDSPLIGIPQDGIVTEVFVNAGDAVKEGDALFEIALSEDIGVSADIPQENMINLSSGAETQIRFRFDDEERMYEADVLAFVCASAGTDDGTYTVYFKLLSPPDGLREGMTAYVNY